MAAPGYDRPTGREQQVRGWLTERDWIAFRSPPSLGVGNVVALKAGQRARIIHVESGAAAFAKLNPDLRDKLSQVAHKAGADAWVCWWPPGRTSARWIPEHEWPVGGGPGGDRKKPGRPRA